MSQQLTLSSIFESTKDELANSLSGLTLPNDSEQVQTIIVNYLNKVCDENSDYRQNLTQSEDYILQAALSMLNAQRELVSAFDCQPKAVVEIPQANPNFISPTTTPKAFQTVNSTKAFIGAGGGALVGKLILGGWGAVFGAVAGTAVALYLSQNNKPAVSKESVNPTFERNPEINEVPVNTSTLLAVISQICDSLDNLIETFRAQIQRVVTKYESQQASSLEDEYIDLLEKIQALLGSSLMSKENDSRTKRIDQRIQLLKESLEDYDLKVVEYNGQNKQLFVFQPSANVTDTTMVLPAITKNDKIIIKGKVFTKQ